MKKLIKKYFTIMLTLSLVMVGGVSVSNAANDHLLIANSKKNTMAYYVNNKFVKEFKISTGRSSSPTPQGKFQIVNKIKNRPYYTGGIPGGSPNNPLGDRWLGLNINGTMGSLYGVHGTSNESSIGKNITDGCIRMYNKEVRWLFDQIPVKSYIIVKNTNESYKQIAAKYGINIENPEPEKKPGWEKVGNDWYYVKQDKKYHKDGWLKVKEHWYYFNEKGTMQTGWKKVGKDWYYLNSNGTMKTRWLEYNNNWFYLREDGGMKTGWLLDKDNWYYFLEDGYMKIGWQQIKGNWYYFNKDGSMAHDTTIDNWTINSDGVAISPYI